MPRPSVAIRLGVEGGAQVKSTFAEIGQAGDDAARRWGKRFEEQSAIATRATERAAQAAQKVAAAVPASTVQARINAAVGGTGQIPNAQDSARFFVEMEDRARSLLAAIDPLYAAQLRYDSELANARQLLDANAISVDAYLAKEVQLRAALDATSTSAERNAETLRMAAAAPDTGLQARINASVGVGDSAGAAANMRLLIQSEEQMEARATALRAAIDPLAAAQERFNQQVIAARMLLAAEAISTEEFAQAEALAQRELDGTTRALAGHAGGARGSSIAQMELMHVVRGSADSFAAGMPPMMIFTQHLGMLAQAASFGGEQMGAFGRFMGGPWGLAVTVGVTLLGTLIGHQLSAASASHEHESAAQTLTRALAGEEDAIHKLNDAIREQREQANAALQTDTRRIEAAYEQARANLAAANSIREVIRAELAQQIAREQAAQQAANDPTQAGEGGFNPGSAQAALHGGRISSLQASLAEQDAAIGRANETMRDHMIEFARALATAEGRVTAEFNDRQRQMEASFAHRLDAAPTDAGKRAIGRELRQAEDQLGRERERALQVVRDQEAAERRLNETRQNGRHITSAQAIAIVQAAGGHVTSAGRPTWIREEVPGGPSSQERLYQRYRAGRGNLAARPGTGNHEYRNGSNALDITGLSIGQVREAFRAQGVSLTELINEGDHVHAAFGGRGRNGEAHAATLARQSDSRDTDIRATLALAQAYLTSSTAAAQAEASRRGLTDATRQGTDASTRVRQALDLETAQTIAQGAQAVLQMRDETASRSSLNDRIAAGTLNVRDMQQQLEDEARLRPLLARQTLAHGEALTILNQTIDATREAMRKLHEEERHGEALRDIAQLRAANDNGRAMLAVTGGNDWDLTLARARRQAELDADQKGYVDSARGNDRSDFVEQRIGEAHTQLRQQAIDQFRQMNDQADDRITLLQTELGLGRMGQSQRDAALRIEQMRLDLERRFGSANEAEIQQILEKARAEEGLRRQVEQTLNSQRELEQVGANVIDEIFNIDNAKDWGAAVTRIIHQILQELLTLAAINPLKNMLFGQNNATLGSVIKALGSIGSAFAGGGGGGDFLGAASKISPGAFAGGTEYASGGLAWIAENGPEIVNLPRGAKVTPAGQTRRMLAANDGAMGALHYYDLRGAVVTEDLMRQMETIAARNVEERADEIAQRGARMVFDVNDRSFGRALRR